MLSLTFPEAQQVSAQLPWVLLLGSSLRKVLGLAHRTCVNPIVILGAFTYHQAGLEGTENADLKGSVGTGGVGVWWLIGAVGAVLQAAPCDLGTCIGYLGLFGRRQCLHFQPTGK